MPKRRILIIIAAACALLLLAGLVWHYWPAVNDWRHTTSRAAFIHDFRGRGLAAAIPLAILLMVVSLVPGAPNAVIAVVSGVCLGAPLGFAVNVIGLTGGNWLGALLVDRVAERHQSKRNARLLDDLKHMRHPQLGVALAYSVPFVPNTLVHLAAADLRLPERNWAGLIALGSVPTAFFYAFGGDAALRLRPGRLVIAVVLLVAMTALIWVIRKDRASNGGQHGVS